MKEYVLEAAKKVLGFGGAGLCVYGILSRNDVLAYAGWAMLATDAALIFRPALTEYRKSDSNAR